jgi:hypothetical protein
MSVPTERLMACHRVVSWYLQTNAGWQFSEPASELKQLEREVL